jgi:hypothetical protein
MNHGKIIVLACAALITGCQMDVPATAAADSSPGKARTESAAPTADTAKQETSSHKEATMVELNAFAEGNSKILSSQQGDLSGNGQQGAILVLDHPGTGSEMLGEGTPRSTLLLMRDSAGKLQKAKQNDRLIPCAQCGGMAGDPFGYVRVDRGGFTALVEGGSRERWSDEYAFKYSAEQQDWLLDKAVRTVTDTETGEEKHIELTGKDFGTIRFEEFDPKTLPKVEGK